MVAKPVRQDQLQVNLLTAIVRQNLLPEKLKLHAPGELRKILVPPPYRGIEFLPVGWQPQGL